ncbi:TonB-dependent receptor plug domain-containing protein [Aliarcobacter thereius]|uniref:Vitamin B12 transporter BtuB n=1 Tax=Aliarcobacter thereius LMG 24486 TaxID=1032240 RepID=A0A1C7WQS2_9BACT|nr:TonB-dependent receptor [Aliarcobacter thereius]OCL95989.1 Vitamin B12 transporter BtuB precursor [Aliarcobacter thereius LMG 24486]QBF16039.1 TonB-dependent receptor [Aliarcobacter thereius LMG 24486]TLS94618.1 TonB-dependent receptor [Aliarcobacter thereius]
MKNKISISLVASFLIATNLYSQETTKLSEITVTSATKSEQKLKDVTANVDVITAEDIESRKFKTVAEALNSLAGVSISSNGGIGQTSPVYLRGMKSENTLVLIDGIRYNDPSGFGANFEHLMINDIERIEVIKGAQSSIWGAEASAGVINIITKSAQSGTHGNASVEYGRYDTTIAKANISHKNENFDAKLGITRVDTNGFSAMSPKSSEAKKYEKDGYENTTVNLKLGYNFNDSNRVSTSYEIIDTKVDIDGDFGAPTYANDPNNLDIAKTKAHLANITYENRNDIALTKVYTNYSDFKREYTSGQAKYKGTIKEYGVNTSIDYINSSNITLGVDYKEFENKANIDKDYNSKAIFISNTNKFFDDKTIFSQALRYDRYSDFDNKATGKIGIKQYIIDDLNISANYGTGYNIPSTFQLYDTSYGMGNPNLDPEKTKSYDIGIEYKGFSITYFNTKVNNLIDAPITVYENIKGNSIFKGTEIAYKNEVIEDTFLNLSYTNLSAKDKDGNKLLNRPTNKFNFGVDYYGLKDFHFNVNGEYIGARYSWGSPNSVKTGNYTIWNAVVDYDISKNFSTYLKLDNIFNKDYQIVDGYATSQRAAYLGIKASF